MGGTPTDAANFNAMQDGLIVIAANLAAAPAPTTLTAEAELEWGHTYFVDATGGAFNVTLPTAVAAGKPIRIVLISVGANQVTVLPHGSEKVRVQGALEPNVALSREATLYNSVEVVSDGTNPTIF